MKLLQNKTVSTTESRIACSQERTESAVSENAPATVYASPRSAPVSVSPPSVDGSPALERAEKEHNTHGPQAGEPLSRLTLISRCTADESQPAEQRYQQYINTACDSPAHQALSGDDTPRSSIANSTQVVACGSMEAAATQRGVIRKGAHGTESSVSVEDAEDIPLDGSRGSELGEKATASKTADLPVSVEATRSRSASAAGEKTRVGFRWRRRQGGKKPEGCEGKQSSLTGIEEEKKPEISRSSKKDSSPEGAVLNALARWKLMFLPMKDWEDERKARSTVVSNLLAQLTSGLAAISAENNVSTGCMLRLLQARTKAIFDLTRSMQQSCAFVSRRCQLPPNGGTSDHGTPLSSHASRGVAPCVVRASRTASPVSRQGTKFDPSCCSSILLTPTGDPCSTALFTIHDDIPSSVRRVHGRSGPGLVEVSSSVLPGNASNEVTLDAGCSQRASKAEDPFDGKASRYKIAAAYRSQSASSYRSHVEAERGVNHRNRSGSRKSDDSIKTGHAIHVERQRTKAARRVADRERNSSSVPGRVGGDTAAPVGLLQRNTRVDDNMVSPELVSKLRERAGTRLQRTLCRNGSDNNKEAREEDLLHGERTAPSLALYRTNRTSIGSNMNVCSQKKGIRWLGKADTVAEAASVARGTTLFSRLSLRPWVWLLLKMTQRSSLQMEALELSEENSLLQETLRVLRSDYERAASAQLSAVRKAKRAQEQELEHVREVLLAVLALEDLERWTHETLRENMIRFYLKTRQSLSTIYAAVDSYLVDVLDASKSLKRRDTSSSTLRFGSSLLADEDGLSPRRSKASPLAQQGHQRGRGSWAGSGGQQQQQLTHPQDEEEPLQDDSQEIQNGRASWLSGRSINTADRPSSLLPPPLWAAARRSEASAASASTGLVSLSSLKKPSLGGQGIQATPAAVASAAAASAVAGRSGYIQGDRSPVRLRGGARRTLQSFLSRRETEKKRETYIRRVASKGKGRQQRHSLQQARSAVIMIKGRSCTLLGGSDTASYVLGRAASLPVLGHHSESAVSHGSDDMLVYSTSQRKGLPAARGAPGMNKPSLVAESTVDTQAAGNAGTSSSSRSRPFCIRRNRHSDVGMSRGAIELAEEEEREEAVMVAALSSAAASDAENNRQGTSMRRETQNEVAALRDATLSMEQPNFSIDRASATRDPSPSNEEERETTEWHDEDLLEPTGMTGDDDTGSPAMTQNKTKEERKEDNKKQEDTAGHPARAAREKEEKDVADTGTNDFSNEELPALQSIPSTNTVFSPAAAHLDLWWLLRRCELLRETGGKVPQCLCNSSILKIAKHLRYPAIPGSVALLKSEAVHRLSGAGPRFSRSSSERWKDGYVLLTWDRFLFMFRDEEAAMSGEPCFLWTAFLPEARVRRIKHVQEEPAVVEVQEKRRHLGLRKPIVSFRPLTDRASEEWVATLRAVAKDSTFLSPAADRWGPMRRSEKASYLSCPPHRPVKTPPVLHAEVLSDGSPVIADEFDSTKVASSRGPETLTSLTHLPSVSLVASNRIVGYEDGGRGVRTTSSPLSALVSVDETSSSAESDIRSSTYTLESGPQQRSESIEGGLLLISHGIRKTEDRFLSVRLQSEHLPIVGTTVKSTNSAGYNNPRVADASGDAQKASSPGAVTGTAKGGGCGAAAVTAVFLAKR